MVVLPFAASLGDSLSPFSAFGLALSMYSPPTQVTPASSKLRLLSAQVVGSVQGFDSINQHSSRGTTRLDVSQVVAPVPSSSTSIATTTLSAGSGTLPQRPKRRPTASELPHPLIMAKDHINILKQKHYENQQN